MDDISIPAGSQTVLSLLQKTTAQNEQTTERLSTGLKVNRTLDDPQAFILAKNLETRAGDLQSVKDGIGQAAGAIGTAQNGVEAIETLSNQLKGIAIAAKGGTAQQRADAAARFDSIRTQIDNIARDTSFNGTNLISAPSDSLTVNLDESGESTLTVSGGASDTASLGINDATTTQNAFATDADIDNAIAEVDQAITTVRATSSSFGSDLAILNTRANFTTDQVNTLRTGASKLVNADLNEEAAKQLSLQVRGQLSITGLNIANQSQRAVLDLF